MATNTENKICQEGKNIIENPPENIHAVPTEKSIFEWDVFFVGCASVLFQATLTIPSSYPVDPPTIRFTIPMFHPNIDSQGNFVCDKIDNSWDKRSNLRMFLTKIQEILDCPEIFPDETFHLQPNQDAAKMYKIDRDCYNRQVEDVNLTWYSSDCEPDSVLTDSNCDTDTISKYVENLDINKNDEYNDFKSSVQVLSPQYHLCAPPISVF